MAFLKYKTCVFCFECVFVIDFVVVCVNISKFSIYLFFFIVFVDYNKYTIMHYVRVLFLVAVVNELSIRLLCIYQQKCMYHSPLICGCFCSCGQ